MLAEAAVDVGSHAGIKGPVAAFQDIEEPDPSRVRRRWRSLRLHPPEHAPVFRFHGTAIRESALLAACRTAAMDDESPFLNMIWI